MFNNKIMGYKFIAFEGTEGAGKTTQIKLLKEYGDKNNIPIHATTEPTKGPVGQFIRLVLKGEVEAKLETLQILYAADRMEHQKEIDEALEKGEIVVSDRYYGTSLTYIMLEESTKRFYEALKALNFLARKPDLWIYITCTVEQSLGSVDKRNDTKEIFDKKEYLEKIYTLYNDFFAEENKRTKVIVIERGNKTTIEMHEEIVQKLKEIGAI